MQKNSSAMVIAGIICSLLTISLTFISSSEYKIYMWGNSKPYVNSVNAGFNIDFIESIFLAAIFIWTIIFSIRDTKYRAEFIFLILVYALCAIAYFIIEGF